MIIDEIEAARTKLALGDEEFRRVGEPEAQQIFEETEAHFVRSGGRAWWWEYYRHKPVSVIFRDQHGYERITKLVPDPGVRAYLIPESDSGTLPPVYACTVRAARCVLGECYAFEYYLVSADRQWLISENHHGALMAIGEPAETRLRALAS